MHTCLCLCAQMYVYATYEYMHSLTIQAFAIRTSQLCWSITCVRQNGCPNWFFHYNKCLYTQREATWYAYMIQNTLGQRTHAYVCARRCVFVCNRWLYSQLHNTNFGNKDAPTLLFNYKLTPKLFSKLAFWLQQMLINQKASYVIHTHNTEFIRTMHTCLCLCEPMCLCMQHMIICTASQYKLWQ